MKLLLNFVAAASLIFSHSLNACSTFVLNSPENVIYGHHLDERLPVPGAIFINKRGTLRTGVSWLSLVSKQEKDTLKWTAKFGSITFNTFGAGMPDGGVNETGLYIQEMSLAGSKPPTDKRKPLYASAWIQYSLDRFSTVDQVLQALNQYSVDGMEWHYLIADRNGNRAVVEFTQGAVQILEALKQSQTQWTYTINLRTKTINIKTAGQDNFRIINWSNIDFKHGPTLVADIHTVATTEQFIPLTAEKHSALAMQGVEWFKSVIGADVLQNYFASQGWSLDYFETQMTSAQRWQEKI